MVKRTRTQAGYTDRQRRGAAIGAYYARKYPYSKWGTQRFPKGSMVEHAGSSWKSATPAQRAWRRQNHYYGQGGYFGKLLGGMAGGLVGAPELGQRIGDKAGDAVWNWFRPRASAAIKRRMKRGKGIYTGTGIYTGNGSYETAANDLVSGTSNVFEVPQFHESSDGVTIKVSHKEYIGDVYGPNADSNFSNQTYRINPGNKSVFPWLSQLAANYDEYVLEQCIFTYKSTVSDFAASSGQVGQVITATQYNAASSPFTDKRSMMEYDAAESAKTTQNVVSGVECDNRKLSGSKGKFVRTGPPKGDINDYDHGVFNIAVYDVPATYAGQALGELWISYTIILRKPKLFTSRGFAIGQDVIQCKTVSNGTYPMGQAAGDLRSYASNNLDIFYINGNIKSTSSSLRRLYDNYMTTGAAAMPSSYVGSMKMVFPANLEGNFELMVSIRGKNSIGTGREASTTAYAEGNIHGIKDIAIVNSSGDPELHASASSNSTQTFTYVLHFRIHQATDGVDNVMYLSLSNWGNALGTSGDIVTTLSIKQYNTQHLKRQDGSNDDPLLLNLVTGDEQPLTV